MIARKLKARAERNRRSVQGELMVILEDAVRTPSHASESEARYSSKDARSMSPAGVNPPEPVDTVRTLGIDELWERGRRAGLSTPNESAAIVRKARNARYGR